MNTYFVTLLGAQCGVLAAHWLGRRWGALPVGLLLGCLVAGAAVLRAWQVLSTGGAAPMLDPLGTVMWANACFGLLLVYVHDGSSRVRSIFLGCLFVFAAVAFGHWVLVRGGAAGYTGPWPLTQCYVAQALALACVLVTACISYQLLANRAPLVPRWLRFYAALAAASCVGAVVLGALFEGSRPQLAETIRRDMAEFVFATVFLIPLGEIYLRQFSLLRIYPEKRRGLFDLVRWMPSYLAREHTEDRHLTLLRSLPDLAFVVNEGGRVIEALNAEDANLQPPPSALRDCHLADAFSPEVAERLHAAVSAALESGRTREVVYGSPDGRRFFSALVSAYHDPLARENRAIVLVHDQTAAHQGMQSLEAEARRFRDAFGAIPAAVFTANAKGAILFSGGADPDALALLPHHGAVPEPGGTLAMAFADCLASGAACLALETPGGPPGRRHAMILRRLQKTAEADGPAIAGIIADIGPLARAWESQSDSERLEALSAFAGRAAHDINNLLVGILGHASLAVRNISPVSRARLNVEQLLKAADQTTDLTGRLLAYARGEQPRLRAIDVSDLAQNARPRLVRALAPNCRLEISADSRVPLVLGDPGEIEAALCALVQNAAEAYGEGGGPIRIRTGSGDPLPADARYLGEPRDPTDTVWIEVADEGEGISPKAIRKVFDPFFSTRPGHGGMGLASALGLMRSLKGGIATSSGPGRGSRFRLCFPPHHPPQPAPSPEKPPDFAAAGLAIVIDDEASVREVAAEILAQMGFRVLTAADGKQGIDTAVEHIGELSLVLLDATMPVMGGGEVFASLRMLKPNLRIIVSSGYAKGDALRGFEAPEPAAFLKKPYTADDLAAQVASLFPADPSNQKTWG